jgi:hypothetical protein
MVSRMNIRVDTRKASTSRETFLLFVVVDPLDPSSAGDLTKSYATSHPSRLEPVQSDTSKLGMQNILTYNETQALLNTSLIRNADTFEHVHVNKYGRGLLVEKVTSNTLISPTRFNISGTRSFSETVSREDPHLLSDDILRAREAGVGTQNVVYHKWLRADVLEDGLVTNEEKGQRTVFSPLLANAQGVDVDVVGALAPFDSSAFQYSGAIGEMTTHLNVRADRVSESPEYGINGLFSMEPMPEFEDGVSNPFSEGIDYIVKEFGNKGVEILEKCLVTTDNLSCVAEALRTLGLMDDVKTAERRFRTLVMLLKHRSAIVRDAAAIGLAYLDDERAIPALHEAIETESLSFLRSDMEAIREQLARR